MSLILVVDPDSRHAAQVATMARKHLKAEFVTADSGFRALEVLADRVPDIVLTAPLLPTRDEAVLSDYLRALGDAGAHVQTLTIPILAVGSTPTLGVRGRFRRDRVARASDGCDPEVFAEQVHQYLKRAEKSRRVDERETGGTGEAGPDEAASEDVGRPVAAEYVAIEADPADYADTEDIDLTPMLADLAEPSSLQHRPELVEGPPPAPVIEAELVEMAVPAQHLITLPAMPGDGGVPSTVSVAVAVSVQVAPPPAAPATTPKKQSKARPIQDEWGFFDPDQCGFRALLARLDAIADEEED